MLKRWGSSFSLKASGTLLLVCLCLIFSFGAENSFAFGGGDSEDDKEDDVRAAIIMAILRYTTWETDADTVNICLLGNNPRFSRLERIDAGIKIHEKSIQVTRLSPNKYTSTKNSQNNNLDCQVIIVGTDNSISVSTLLSGSACVVICDGCEREKDQSAIIVRKEKDRIRFDVNLDNASSQRVKFSAKMLELAANIKGLHANQKEKIDQPLNVPDSKNPSNNDKGGALEQDEQVRLTRYPYTQSSPQSQLLPSGAHILLLTLNQPEAKL